MTGFQLPSDLIFNREPVANPEQFAQQAGAGATPEEVLAAADADGAPFTGVEEYRQFVVDGLSELA